VGRPEAGGAAQPEFVNVSAAPPTARGATETPFDVRRLARVLDSRKWPALAFAAFVVAGVTAWTLRQVPIYRATSTVQVDLTAPRVLGREVEQVEELGTGSYWNNQEYLLTQVKVIQSREVALRVVKLLNLAQDPDFTGPEDDLQTPTEIAEAVRIRIKAAPVRDSRLLEIAVEDSDPVRARDIANATADAYLEQNVERMLSSTVSAVDWLSRQASELQERLEESERALHTFRRDNDILSVSLEDRQNIVANQIQKLSDALTASRTRSIDLGSKVNEMRELSSMDPLEIPVAALIDNPLIQELKRQHAQLARERDGLAKRYGKNWPRIQEIDEEIDGVRGAIGREVRSVLESMEGEYRAAKRSEAGLRAALNEMQAEALKINVHEVEYNRLARAQKNNAQLYELVLGRTTETDLASGIRVNNLHVLDYAVTPTVPARPQVVVNVLMAIFFGILGGIGLAFALEMLDVTVKTQTDLDRFGVAFLGLLPSIEPAIERRKKRRRGGANGRAQVGEKKDLFVHEHPKSTVSEACRSIRTNLLFMSAERELETIVVTSPGPREGKTTVAMSLAIAMAQNGSRTVIIDTDMRRPRVHHAFGIDNGIGISSVIVGHVSLEEAIRETEVPGLSVLSCGPVPPNPSELLHTQRFREVLVELKEMFDRVVFDSPPMGAVTDAAILATLVDGVVLVAKAGQTRKEGVRHALGQLREIRARVFGTVLNDVDLSRREYGYYNYYYRRGGKRGYYAYGEEGEKKENSSEASVDASIQ
jgi:capsular exopolysaccharide synthesis family protein